MFFTRITTWLHSKMEERKTKKARNEWLREASLLTKRRTFWHPLDASQSSCVDSPTREDWPTRAKRCVVNNGHVLLCECRRPGAHDAETKRHEHRAAGMPIIYE
ncbi:hypothetical protein BDV32DRAFT_152554 [Aspergillus pseudonomiae]|nr:hypothetical protein BDV32DRAFT_152554 [Aspergillus pseudonomiae]